MEKGADAFRTISEVAEELDLPQHVLRFWETRFAQIRPLKRGGGRRYYRPDDIDLLRAIRHLLYGEGYTIKGVQRLLKEHGVRMLAQTPIEDLHRAAPAQLPSDLAEADLASEAAAASGSGRPVPDVRPERREPQAGAVRPGPSPNDVRVIRAVLADLDECDRILSAARGA